MFELMLIFTFLLICSIVGFFLKIIFKTIGWILGMSISLIGFFLGLIVSWIFLPFVAALLIGLAIGCIFG